MNEAETRAEHIDPALKAAGWGVVEGSRILREHAITQGRLQGGGKRARAEIADYVLVYRNTKLAVVEAKDNRQAVGAGMPQAIRYGELLDVPFCFSSNGDGFVFRDATLDEGVLERTLTLEEFPSPAELWARYCAWKGWTPRACCASWTGSRTRC